MKFPRKLSCGANNKVTLKAKAQLNFLNNQIKN